VKLVVHVDGGSRGNPGPAAAAAVLSTPDGEDVDRAV
jgi:ribonuclease HI